MSKSARGGPWLVYLLHFDRPVAGFAHYVGITTPARLDARMREHASGRAAKGTATACESGVNWSLASVFPTNDRTFEAQLTKHEQQWKFCTVCCGGQPLRSYGPTKTAVTARSRPFVMPDLYHISASGKASSSTMKKGKSADRSPLSPCLRQT